MTKSLKRARRSRARWLSIARVCLGYPATAVVDDQIILDELQAKAKKCKRSQYGRRAFLRVVATCLKRACEQFADDVEEKEFADCLGGWPQT